MTERNDHDDALLTQAAERLLRAHRSGVRPENDLEFARWRSANTAQDAAAADVLDFWELAPEVRTLPGYPGSLGTPTLRERLGEVVLRVQGWFQGRWLAQVRPTPMRLTMAAACLSMLVVVTLMVQRPPAPAYQTQIAEVRELPLADGSIVTLGAKSEIEKVNFTGAARRVIMGTGEAFFSVAKNRDRPFLIEVGDTLIRVVGTKFNVKYDGTHVKVSVVEGVVEVMRPGETIETITSSTGLPHVTLKAGQQTMVANAAAQFDAAITPVSADSAAAWREGRLSYEDAPLSEVIADANRYRPGRIRILGHEIGGRRFNTSFMTSQIDQMLDTLPATMGVKIRRMNDGSVEISAP